MAHRTVVSSNQKTWVAIRQRTPSLWRAPRSGSSALEKRTVGPVTVYAHPKWSAATWAEDGPPRTCPHGLARQAEMRFSRTSSWLKFDSSRIIR
ncbi:hypothetical protein B296_00054761 [Ensete ventricosum]|uniref:Uncharacterized protein n=1 Tax=Ensete ventricosum TaxID=4639 RepID=A0A426XC32_ENSVE|nr:hypothetical protein B296_00054761 [Ensete ventricosum]